MGVGGDIGLCRGEWLVRFDRTGGRHCVEEWNVRGNVHVKDAALRLPLTSVAPTLLFKLALYKGAQEPDPTRRSVLRPRRMTGASWQFMRISRSHYLFLHVRISHMVCCEVDAKVALHT